MSGRKHASRNRGDWAKDGVVERLGEVRDRVIADEVGVTRQRVEQVRKQLGIASYGARHALPQEFVELLGLVSDRDLAERFEVEKHRVVAARRRAGIAPYRLIGPLKIAHGTRYAYCHYYCRCTPCTAANARDQSALRKRNPKIFEEARRRQKDKVLASAPHKVGKITWYNLGCTCDGCAKAAKNYQSPAYKRARTTSLQWGGSVLIRRGGATLSA